MRRGSREIWVKRPILWGLAAYIAGLVFSVYFRVEALYCLLGMTGAALLALVFRRKAVFPLLLSLVLIFGCLRGALFFGTRNPLAPYVGKRITIQGTVTGDPQIESDRAVYVLDVQAVQTGRTIHIAGGKVRVGHYAGFSDGGLSRSKSASQAQTSPSGHVPAVSQDPSFSVDSPDSSSAGSSGSFPDPGKGSFSEAFQAGDVLRVTATLKEPTGPRNPRGFDYKGYLARRGIYSMMNASGRNVVFLKKVRSFSVSGMLARFRRQADISLDRTVGGQEGALLKALLLGQRWTIEPGTVDAFQRTGLAHVLSISGLHIGYIVMLLHFLFSRFPLQRWTPLIFEATILLLYCLLVGAAPSVMRAVVMAVIYSVGKTMGRKSDTINSAGVAAFLILLIRPMDILEVGFQLSFLAVGSIALLYRPIQERLRFLPSKVSSLIAVTLSAQLGTFPLTVYCFNTLTPWSVLTNLVLVPALGAVTMGGFLILPVGMIFPAAAKIAAVPLRVLCRLVLAVTDLAAKLPFASIPAVSPSIPAILVYYLVLLTLSRERPAFIRRPYVVCTVLIGTLVAGPFLVEVRKPKDLEVTFVDVGQGDCTLIRTPDGKTILMDGGGKEDRNVGEDTVLPFLLKNGVSSLDLVIMSHCHYDHIGGLLPVLEQLPVDAFMEYPPGQAEPAYLELKETVRRKGIDVLTAKRGQTWRIGREVKLHILYPEDRVVKSLAHGNENNYSLVILMEYQDTSVLFTGDMEDRVEYYLAGRIRQENVDILKVPHHGSRTSSTESFLDAISPKAGVIQVGINLFGHPSPQTLDRLEQRGARVYRNDEQGAVMMHYRDKHWRIRTMLQSP